MSKSGAMISGKAQQATDGEALAETYGKFVQEYDRAGELCAKVQLFRKAAGIPAINEMRYAGYHLRHALDETGALRDRTQLEKARGHAQRASYEAAEAGLLLALEEINLFKNDYRNVVVTGDVKEYIVILSECEEAQRRLGVRRQLGDGQELDHVRHQELFETLSKAANLLHAARPEINKRMREARTGKIRWIVTTVIAVLTLGVAIFKDKIATLFF